MIITGSIVIDKMIDVASDGYPALVVIAGFAGSVRLSLYFEKTRLCDAGNSQGSFEPLSLFMCLCGR